MAHYPPPPYYPPETASHDYAQALNTEKQPPSGMYPPGSYAAPGSYPPPPNYPPSHNYPPSSQNYPPPPQYADQTQPGFRGPYAPGPYPPPGVYPAPPPPPQTQPTVVEILAPGQQEKPPESFFVKAKVALPVMPLWLAIICAILNIIPGVGTFVAGCATLCLPNYRDSLEKTGSFCINAGVSALQFLTVFLLGLGFFWSITWGVLFIIASKDYKKSVAEAREKQNQNEPL